MRIFIAGATGVLGRRVTRKLVEHGHHVVGLARSVANIGLLAELGAEAREADLFDAVDVKRAARDCDAVLHLATAIPTHMPNKLSDWATNDRIRTIGTRNLVDAALANQCRVYVQQSVLYVYGDQHGAWIDERTPLAKELGGVLQSALDMEHIVKNAAARDHLPAITLRFGVFYGPDAAHTQSLFEQVERGRGAILGDGENWWNMLQLDDAARAVVAAVEKHEGNLGEAFNIADGSPIHMRELLAGVAEIVGAKRPWQVPLWMARMMIGQHLLQPLLMSFRCASDKARERLGWLPLYPDFKYGHQAALKAWRGELVGA
jgi:nucleoside-diphosphate-sugar epimerase